MAIHKIATKWLGKAQDPIRLWGGLLLERPGYKRNSVWPIIYDEFFLTFKEKWPNIKINICGSIRREIDIIHDFDVVIGSKNPEIIEWCCKRIYAELILPEFRTEIKGFLRGIPIQIWFCNPDEYGPHLLLKTGPQTFNRKLASIAKRLGLTLSEHGLFKGSPDNRQQRIDENTEANIIWIILGCKWIHPKDRY